jgi:hypothetical protein
MSVLARESWGPQFWSILHTFAECSGEQTNIVLDIDERTAWHLLLKAQAFVMPCALCRQHYNEWLLGHRVGIVESLKGGDRNHWLRTWLYECHASVNRLNGTESPPFDMLPDLYPRRSIDSALKKVTEMFQKALEQRVLKPEDISRWRQQVIRLRIIYGV